MELTCCMCTTAVDIYQNDINSRLIEDCCHCTGRISPPHLTTVYWKHSVLALTEYVCFHGRIHSLVAKTIGRTIGDSDSLR